MLLLAYIKKNRSDFGVVMWLDLRLQIKYLLPYTGHEIEKPVIDDLHVIVEFGPQPQIKKISATGNNAVSSVV